MSLSNDAISEARTTNSPGVVTSEGTFRRPSFRLPDLWKAPLHDLPTRDEILYQYLPLSIKMNVLEIGPGSGFTAFRMARHVRQLTLVDVSAENVARLRSALKDVPNLRIVCADLCTPGLADSLGTQLDAIYALEVFEYLLDPGTCLNNFAAMLRPRGSLLLEFPNYPPPRSPGITCFRTRAELDQLLQAAGFESWAIYALRLRPYARLLYEAFHERPLRYYRKHQERNRHGRAMRYEQTWAFQNKSRLEAYKPMLHLAWTGLIAGMRLRGDCFERTLLRDEILNHDLLVLAKR